MKPIFKTSLAWEQAELLMQPILLRVIDNLRKELETSDWAGTYEEVNDPYPGYRLYLTHQNHTVTVDIWQLCFQICFLNYPSSAIINEAEINPEATEEVEVDTRLIDENGDVDWQQLETKTKCQMNSLFASLPTH